MAFFWVKAKFSKHGTCRLLSELQVENEFRLFNPRDQFLCLHIEKLRNPVNYKRRHQISMKLNSKEYSYYFDVNTYQLKFGNSNLMSESEYRDSNTNVQSAGANTSWSVQFERDKNWTFRRSATSPSMLPLAIGRRTSARSTAFQGRRFGWWTRIERTSSLIRRGERTAARRLLEPIKNEFSISSERIRTSRSWWSRASCTWPVRLGRFGNFSARFLRISSRMCNYENGSRRWLPNGHSRSSTGSCSAKRRVCGTFN